MASINSALNQADQTFSNEMRRRLKDVGRASRLLSTGEAIQTGADSPGVLSKDVRLVTKMKSAIQARLNINQSISLAQTAEARLGSLVNPLHRLNEMSLQAVNETLSDEDRRYLQVESDELVKQISQTVAQSTFNGHKLLNGEFQAQVTQDGMSSSESVHLSIPPLRFEDTTLTYAGDQDIVFLVDATGSMQAAIDSLADNLQSFVASFEGDVSGGDIRFAVIAYTNTLNAQDPVGKPFEVVNFQTITESGVVNQNGFDTIQGYLEQLNTGGYVEAIDEVIQYSNQELIFRDNAEQHLVMLGSVGDEATNNTVKSNALDAAREFIESAPNRKLSTVAVERSGNPTSTYFRDELTPIGGGEYFEFPSQGGLAAHLSEIMVSSVDGVDLSSSEAASKSISWINYFLENIDVARSNVAGFQSSLEHKLSFKESEEVIQEGVRGRLSSADYASLSIELSKSMITLESNAVMQGEMIRTFGASLIGMIESWGIA